MFDPVSLGIMALVGGGVAAAKYWGSKKTKPQATQPYQAVRQMDVQGGKELWQELERRKNIAPSMRDIYYRDIYGPTAANVRDEWKTQVESPLMSTAGAMGRERSSGTLGLIGRELAKRELGLGQLGGELRARGYERGLQEEDLALGGLQTWVGNEAAEEAKARGVNYQGKVADQLATRQWETDRANIPGEAITTAGNVYGAMQPSIWEELLKRQSGGGGKRTSLAMPKQPNYYDKSWNSYWS